MLHLLMFAEIGIPLLACLFLEINALDLPCDDPGLHRARGHRAMGCRLCDIATAA